MPKDAVEIDDEHQFTGVTITVRSVYKIKSEVDGGEMYVQVRCHDRVAHTKHRLNDRQTLLFDQSFFYNTTQLLDDDISFQLHHAHNNLGTSRHLTSSSASNNFDKFGSKLHFTQGKLLGTTKDIQISRMKRQKKQHTLDLLSVDNKIVGKLVVVFEYLERQDIVGGIRCPSLSLKPQGRVRRELILENKYSAYKNIYSFLDGGMNLHCQFFPKKFKH